MKKPLTRENLAIYVAKTVAHLPENIRLRRVILENLIQLLPEDMEERTEIAKMLATLNAHEMVQVRFANKLERDGGDN